MVFSGGGTRCFWHGGFVTRIREEVPLDPVRVTGVSGGALAAAAWLGGATPRHVRVVAEVGRRVVGWAASEQFRPKPAYADSLELSVYVAPDQLGAGVGRALAGAVVSALRRDGAHRLYAVVADHAPASTALMESLGMRHVGTLHEAGRKHGRRVDVDLWELAL